MAWKAILFRRGFWLVCAALALIGCQEQEPIRHYRAPKESKIEAPAARLLAVMVTRGEEAWYFKFVDSQKEVSKHEADFDALIHSVHFKEQGKNSLDFTVPEGWRRQWGPREPRYATLRLGPKGQGLEITITKLVGREAADVRANVDRWREQLGLPPLDDEAFRKLHDNIKVDGIGATRVDVVGTRRANAAAMNAQPPREAPKGEALPFRYQRPEGWETQPPIDKQGIHIPLVLRVRGNGEEAEMTGMSLPGDGGGLAMNVNRWRRQVGLAAASEAQIRRDARILKAADQPAIYVDLSGPGMGAARRILGVLLPHGRQTWFFTLKGPPDLVGKEQAHFEAFIASIRFDGEAGAAHE